MGNPNNISGQDAKFFSKPKRDHIRIPEPSLPNGQKPDFGNSQAKIKRPYQNSQNPKNQVQQQQSKSKPKQQKPLVQKKKQIPSSNAQFQLQQSPEISRNTTYVLGPSQNSGSSKQLAKDIKVSNYAGPTFHNSPETKSLPKPSFL